MKLPKDIRDKIIDAFGIKNLTIASFGGLTAGSFVFVVLLALLDEKGGSHE